MNEDWIVRIPEGKSGDWSVEYFTVTEEETKLDRLRAACNPSALGRYVPAGEYMALKRRGTIVMSTTPDELRDFQFLRHETGSGLIAGLGLGCAVTFLLHEPSKVETVTVIEKSPDVLALVGQTLYQAFPGKLILIQADIFTWEPPKGMCWDWGWYDIWDNICGDNLPEMTKIKRRFGRRVARQFCWQEHHLRYQARKEREYESMWRI